MSKTTKALAALGVVAGLGIAALPLSASAATDRNGIKVHDGGDAANNTATDIYDGTPDGSVKDTIKVKTVIDETLTLTITGANDATGDTGDNHLVLLGTDGKIQNGDNASGAATVNVATNRFKGYNVTMVGEAAGFNGTANPAEKFAPVTDDTVTFPTSNASVFGYQTTTTGTPAGTFSLTKANWMGVPTTPTEIAKNTAATELNGDDFTITFQAHASESQAADTYDEVVTITAVANV